eukprot:TRINITY_DN3319_c0_g1_i2.p1 TRINITY_DN3319_c0_g1~~TRINITY_DN3319_c0_g1_i2.p1  ORF type:complete len:513 (-),score=110.17 TRINITY_DN3319_c0_g1_i2:50-1588(-)
MEINAWFILKAIVFGWFMVKIYNLFIREWIYFFYYMRQGLKLDFYRPLIGGFLQLRQDQIQHGDANYFAKSLIQKNPKKRIIMSSSLGHCFLVLQEHKLVEEFYKNSNMYEKDQLLTFNFVRAFGNGILFMEGDRWKLHRRLLSDAFNFDNLKKMTPIVMEAVKEHFAEMADQKRLKKVGIMNEFQKITGDIVLKAFFGSKFSKEIFHGKPLTVFLADYLEEISLQPIRNPLSFIFGQKILTYNLTANDRKVNGHSAALKELGRKTIENRKKEESKAYSKDEGRKDLLDFILNYNEKNKDNQLSNDEIIDTFITLFLAGMDTTGHLLGLSIYYLWKYPEYVARIMDEATRNGINFDNITIDDLNSLKFLEAFLKEVLRLGTPTIQIMPRKAIETHQLADITILKGTIVSVGVNAIGFNELYFDQPYEFRPERFLNEKEDKWSKLPFAYIPFSAGPRHCIGKYLAMIEAKSILLMFLKKFSFKMTNPDYTLKMGMRFLYEPLDPVEVDLIPLA